MCYDRPLLFLNIRRGVKCNYRFTPGCRNYRFVRHLCLTLAVHTNIARIIFGAYLLNYIERTKDDNARISLATCYLLRSSFYKDHEVKPTTQIFNKIKTETYL